MAKKFNENPTKEVINAAASNIEKTLSDAVDGGSTLASEIHVKKDAPFSTKDTKEQFEKLTNQETLTESKEQKQVHDFITSLKNEEPQDFSPDIQVGARPRATVTSGMTSESYAIPQPVNQSGFENIGKTARPASKKDLDSFAASLNESQIMDIPWIKATDDIIPGILFLKPKDPQIRFHWVNYKNYEGGNYQYYSALGFVNAGPNDVDIEKTPIWPSALHGSEIKWYDVILMKINVFVLMARYKRNIMASLRMVGRFQETARSLAQKQFYDELYAGVVEQGAHKGEKLISAYRRMKSAGHNVEFYIPGLDNMSDKEWEKDQQFRKESGPDDMAFTQGLEAMNEGMHT